MLVAAMSACKKDESTTTPAVDARTKTINALVANAWKADSTVYTVMGEKTTEIPEDCELDNYLEFKSDGKQIMYFGAKKCDPTEQETITIAYKVNTAGDSLTVVVTPEEYAYKIQSLASGKLVINGVSEDGTETIYFSKK